MNSRSESGSGKRLTEGPETTEQQVARLLKIVQDPNQLQAATHLLEEQEQYVIEILAQLVADRASTMKRLAVELQEKADAIRREAERVQKLSDDLAQVAAQLSNHL